MTNEKREMAEIVKSLKEEKEALILGEIDAMAWEITQSIKSSSVLILDPATYCQVSHREYTPSTFPKWFGECKFNASADVAKCVKRGKGIRFKRMRQEAINRLTHGYTNDHGYDVPHYLFEEVPF